MLGYHQSIGTNLNDVVFENKATEVDEKVYVGELSVKREELGGDFSLNQAEIKTFSFSGSQYFTLNTMEEKEESSEEFMPSKMGMGAYHSFFITDGGSLYGWGRNSDGQVGDGTLVTRTTPVKINIEESVKAVEGGMYHTAALTEDGKVYTWGENRFGQLGLGFNSVTHQNPSVVSGLGVVKDITVGNYVTMALLESGEVYSWGQNGNGELGIGNIKAQNTPQKIEGLENVKEISMGNMHTVALLGSGEVYAWGHSDRGQLGDGNRNNRIEPQFVQNLPEIKDIATGAYYSVAIAKDGTLYAWGQNTHGQLGRKNISDQYRPLEIERVGKVSDVMNSNGYNMILRDEEGKVKIVGFNVYGQLADGTKNTSQDFREIVEIGEIKDIIGGNMHMMAVNNEGTIYTWGRNDYGQLGNESETNSLVPVEVKIDQ